METNLHHLITLRHIGALIKTCAHLSNHTKTSRSTHGDILILFSKHSCGHVHRLSSSH